MPILKVADPNKDFTVCIDASKDRLGGVLTHEGHVIHALKMWRHYIMGRKFLLLTDNSGVKYMFNQPDLNARQARWLSFLSKFDFKVRDIKGKENKVADALSRRIHGLFEINIYRADSDLEQRVRTTGVNDRHYSNMMTKFQNSIANSDKLDISIDKKGLLRFKNRLYVPDSTELKLTILDKVHNKPYSVHPSTRK
jgi:hypothetical protein